MVWADRETYEEILTGEEITAVLDSQSVSPVLVTIKIVAKQLTNKEEN